MNHTAARAIIVTILIQSLGCQKDPNYQSPDDVIHCSSTADCPVSQNPCAKQVCATEVCVAEGLPKSTVIADQTIGSCTRSQCDGGGNIIEVADDTDIPDDGSTCTIDSCNAGVPAHSPVAQGTLCADNGGSLCDENGACVECIVAADCPGENTACKTKLCNAGTCSELVTPEGMPGESQADGDCSTIICGAGGVEMVMVNDADIPIDGNDCTNDVCTAGVPSNPALPVDKSCGDGGTKVCDANGACVECTNGSQCASNVCDAGVCLMASCSDNTLNGNESDIDCGGACSPCWSGKTCTGASDCASGLCSANVCLPTEVVNSDPADGATAVAVDSTISVVFSGSMDPTTLNAQSSVGSCSGSVQVSTDGFLSCIGFSNTSPVMTANNAQASWTALPGLSQGTTYAVRVTTAAQGVDGVAIAAPYTSATGFTTKTPSAAACIGSVVISQVYAAGGNAGASFKNDFMELKNRGTTPVSLAGYSVQYSSAASASWAVTALSGTIAPGGYFLVQLGGGTNGMDLPTADATGTTNLSATAGKVALVQGITALSGVCPSGSQIIDLVGYGNTASCFEGSAPASVSSNTTMSIHRATGGCVDTGDNKADFATGASSPQNSSSPLSVCSCAADVTINETAFGAEIDGCQIDSPATITITEGDMPPAINGRVFETGLTEAAGANPSILVQVGFGPLDVNPTTQSGYQFFPTTYATQAGNDDLYQGIISAAIAAGSYRYVYRASIDGASWTYCDLNGSGSNAGAIFEITQLGQLVVMP